MLAARLPRDVVPFSTEFRFTCDVCYYTASSAVSCLSRAFGSQVRDTLRELDRLSAESWRREVEKAKVGSREPARPLSPSTAARVSAKLQARAVRNLPLRGPAPFDLDNLD